MNDMKFKEWWEQYSRNDFRRSDEIARDAWAEAVKNHQLLIDAARKAVRCLRNGQWKNLEDAVLLMEVALNECDEVKASNATGQARPQGVACTDGLGTAVPSAPTFEGENSGT